MKAIKGGPLKKGRHIARQELRDLFAACAADPSAAAGGMRPSLRALWRGAAAGRGGGLDLKDLSAEGAVVVRAAKGNKSRIVPLEPRALEAVPGVAVRPRPRARAPLPPPAEERAAGSAPADRRSDHLHRAPPRRRGGIQTLTPHDFRRTFATDLLEANIDLVTVRDLMGHSDINTTAGYDRRSEDAKRRGAEVLRVPFVG